ncbi:MAG TPA: glutamine-hydrolyzing GMP synthase [Chloroflexota bacterium]
MTPRRQTVAILDFGSQYSQLIARRVRECSVYCELVHPEDAAAIERLDPEAFILSGGPASVYEPGAPQAPEIVFSSGKPVLGICYGMQLVAHQLGGSVAPASRREYGHASVRRLGESPLFADLPGDLSVWMSHGDHVDRLPPGFVPLARSDNSSVAAMARGNVVAIQFHPEVVHTVDGKRILENFLYRVAGLRGDWTPASFVEETIARLRAQIGQGRAICGLSGGVDSAVAAALTHRAIGERLTCVFVDHGLLRKGEPEQVQRTFRDALGLNLVVADAADRFLERLAGVVDPEEKRRRIGHEFVRVFEHEASRLSATAGQFDYLVQGTLYPDVIESASQHRTAQTIKTHHNVGGLPEQMEFDLVEPLRFLFKDEVRRIGLELGLPEELVWRHPFPGPGLAIRVIGQVTPERLDTLREADAIFLDELRAAGLYRDVSQALAVLTPLQTVGVMGDNRTYANVVALRAVATDDFMTADWARLPYDLLARVSSRIVNEVPGINRVVYDVSSKPPATIEWE